MSEPKWESHKQFSSPKDAKIYVNDKNAKDKYHEYKAEGSKVFIRVRAVKPKQTEVKKDAK